MRHPSSITSACANSVCADLIVSAIRIILTSEACLSSSSHTQAVIATLIEATLIVCRALKWNRRPRRAALSTITHLVHGAVIISRAPISTSSSSATISGSSPGSSSGCVIRGVISSLPANTQTARAVDTDLRCRVAHFCNSTVVVCLAWLGLTQASSANLSQKALVVIPARIQRASVQAFSGLAANTMIILAFFVHSALRVNIAPITTSRRVGRIQCLTSSSKARLVHIALRVASASKRVRHTIPPRASLRRTTVVVDRAGLLRGRNCSTRFKTNP